MSYDYEKPIDVHIKRMATIKTKLHRILEITERHCVEDPETIHWGHVGDLGRIIRKLDELMEIYYGTIY